METVNSAEVFRMTEETQLPFPEVCLMVRISISC